MINYLIKIITTLWFIFFCLQVSVAQEIDVNQTRKHLLQTLQDNSVDKQQRMELYIDLYDLSRELYICTDFFSFTKIERRTMFASFQTVDKVAKPLRAIK